MSFRRQQTIGLAALAALSALVASRAAGAEVNEHDLVRFTSERSVLVAGGHPTPDRFTVLTAEIAPAAEGVEILFSVAEGTGRGLTVPAMLSRSRVETGASGVARTCILSSDAEERCTVRARLRGGGRLELVLDFRRTLAGEMMDGSVAAAPSPTPARRGAAVLAAQLRNPSVEVRTAAKRFLVALGRDAVGVLMEAAADPRLTPDVRSLAVRTLAEMRTEEADDELLALLAHPLPDVRAGTEEAISMMSAARAQTLAEGALLSDSPLVRAAALRILGCLATEGASRAIEKALADADPFVRATAAWESARAAGPGAEEALARAMGDGETFVRVSAARAVVLLGRPRSAPRGGRGGDEAGALDRLLRRWLSDPDPAMRSAAAKAVGRRELTAETALKPLLTDPDPRVRLSVAFAFTWRADVRSSLRHLRALTGDAEAAPREVACRAIAEFGTEAEADVMIEMLASGDPVAKALAARGLRRVTCLDFGWNEARTEAERAEVAGRWRDWWGASGDLSREAWLRQALDLPGSKLRGAAGLELARSMPSAGTPKGGAPSKKRLRLAAALEEIARSRDATERHAAAEALLVLGKRAGLAPLEADLADVRLYVRLGAVKAISRVVERCSERDEPERREVTPAGSVREAARLLVAALEDPWEPVRRRAARALRDLTGESFGYGPQASAEHRARGVRRWREWIESLPPAATARDRAE